MQNFRWKSAHPQKLRGNLLRELLVREPTELLINIQDYDFKGSFNQP